MQSTVPGRWLLKIRDITRDMRPSGLQHMDGGGGTSVTSHALESDDMIRFILMFADRGAELVRVRKRDHDVTRRIGTMICKTRNDGNPRYRKGTETKDEN
jgi:hypothetical protein